MLFSWGGEDLSETAGLLPPYASETYIVTNVGKRKAAVRNEKYGGWTAGVKTGRTDKRDVRAVKETKGAQPDCHVNP